MLLVPFPDVASCVFVVSLLCFAVSVVWECCISYGASTFSCGINSCWTGLRTVYITYYVVPEVCNLNESKGFN
jgi:hypothetical protein